jgi:hypothetical protein
MPNQIVQPKRNEMIKYFPLEFYSFDELSRQWTIDVDDLMKRCQNEEQLKDI